MDSNEPSGYAFRSKAGPQSIHTIECPNCGESSPFSEDAVGTRVECPQCRQHIEISPTIRLRHAQMELSGNIVCATFSCPFCGKLQRDRSASKCTTCHTKYRRGFCPVCGSRKFKSCGCAHRPVVWGTAADPLCTNCGQTFSGRTMYERVEDWFVAKFPGIFTKEINPEMRRCPRCAVTHFFRTEPVAQLRTYTHSVPKIYQLLGTVAEPEAAWRSDIEQRTALGDFQKVAFSTFSDCLDAWTIKVYKSGDRGYDPRRDKEKQRIIDLMQIASGLAEYHQRCCKPKR